MKKQEIITQVNNCISSVFAKEDVIKLIEQIEDGDSMSELKAKDFAELITDKFRNRLDRMSNDEIIDFDSAEFSLNYDNRVELDNIAPLTDSIVSELETIVEKAISATFNVVPEDIEENVVSC